MVYTCAYFHDWNEDIDTAQQNKLEMVCRKLRLKPGETMLDLGCGWGGLLIMPRRKYGVSGYGVTLAEGAGATRRKRSGGSDSKAGSRSRSAITRRPTASTTRSLRSAF